METPEDRYQRQLELEKQCADAAEEQWKQYFASAKQHGNVGESQIGASLLKRLIAPMARDLAQQIVAGQSGKAGRKSIATVRLGSVEPPVACYITLKTALNYGMRVRSGEDTSFARVALDIGREIEDELWFREFERQYPQLWKKVIESTKGDSFSHRAVVLRYAARKFSIEWDGWSRAERLHVGTKLLEVARDSTGMLRFDLVSKTRRKNQWVITLTQSAVDFLEERSETLAVLSPTYLPTIVPPKDWEGLSGGGYHSDYLRPVSLVKDQVKVAEAEEWTKNMSPEVMDAVNAVQRTPWKINTSILEIVQEVYGRDLAYGDMPPGHLLPEPVKPAHIDNDPEARKEWKKEKVAVIKANKQRVSKRLQVRLAKELAEKFQDEEEIYFPHCLDFRGRLYSIPASLNPQGPDYVKALLLFAHGKPLHTQDAADWLAIHGANCWGHDKVSYAERIEWVHNQKENIWASAADPLGHLWWTEADEPWQFLAWCFEWCGYLTDGLEFVTHLPIGMDGSCNGLQHFSAMLRDPVGADAVNLVPHDQPRDIYQRVADVTSEHLAKVAEDPEEGDTKRSRARRWLRFGLTRKTAKRPVMVLPYGGTRQAFQTYIREDFESRVAAGEHNPFAGEEGMAVIHLANIMWKAVGEVVVAARAVMDSLRSLSRAATKHTQPIKWITPIGFPCHQAYIKMDERRVKTQLGGSLVYFRVHEQTDKLDGSRQANGVSPNFVHSLDAAHLMFTVLAAQREGIESFHLVHDSYGTLAADASALSRILREQFVSMYEQYRPLEHLWSMVRDSLPSDAKLPEVPGEGTFDLRQVLESPYFFG